MFDQRRLLLPGSGIGHIDDRGLAANREPFPYHRDDGLDETAIGSVGVGVRGDLDRDCRLEVRLSKLEAEDPEPWRHAGDLGDDVADVGGEDVHALVVGRVVGPAEGLHLRRGPAAGAVRTGHPDVVARAEPDYRHCLPAEVGLDVLALRVRLERLRGAGVGIGELDVDEALAREVLAVLLGTLPHMAPRTSPRPIPSRTRVTSQASVNSRRISGKAILGAHPLRERQVS